MEGYSEVIDVSDRAQPTVVAKWNPETEFGLAPEERVDNCQVTILGDRLYVVQGDLSSNGSSLLVLDISGDPQTPNIVNRIWPGALPAPEGVHPGDPRGAHAIGDRLYITVSGHQLQQPPQAPLIVVDPATLEP